MKADYDHQTTTLTAVLEKLTAERAELASGVDNEHPALVAFMKYQNIECLTRDILVELVDHIKVYENGTVRSLTRSPILRISASGSALNAEASMSDAIRPSCI